MTTADSLWYGLREIGRGVRRPEALAKRWRDRAIDPQQAPRAIVFPLLLANAVLGLATYGLVMHLHGHPTDMLRGALLAPLAAGMAWAIALPTLYIFGRVLGSRLDPSTTFLAALVTVSFGAMAMLASIPVLWFFQMTLPYSEIRLPLNLIIFAGVGTSMGSVFLRVLAAVEPKFNRKFSIVWLTLISVLGTSLFSLFGTFNV